MLHETSPRLTDTSQCGMDAVYQYPMLTVEKCRLSVERLRGALKLIVSKLVEWSYEGKLWCRTNELGRYRVL